MKVYFDVIQNTPEWHALRAGIPTSSAFDRIVTPKGRASSQAEKYMFQLLAERLMGHPIEEFSSHWQDRGSRMESDAVASYEFQRDLDTTKVGFITNDFGTIGASPDRLVNEDGLLEIKVPSEAVHISYLLRVGSAYEEYKVQVQGQLWIAERRWSDVLSFHPELPEALIRIERDEDFIEKLSLAVEAFSQQLEELTEMAVKRGWLNPKEPREETLTEMLRASLREMNR